MLVRPTTNRSLLMRAKRECQLPLTVNLGEHSHVGELNEISRILDENEQTADLVTRICLEICAKIKAARHLPQSKCCARQSCIRCIRLVSGNSHSELEFNQAYRYFCRLNTISTRASLRYSGTSVVLVPETWAAIHRSLIKYAAANDVEDGKVVRTDCTVMESTIHAPTDSSLLWDCVRKLTDLLDEIRKRISSTYLTKTIEKVANGAHSAFLTQKGMAKKCHSIVSYYRLHRKQSGMLVGQLLLAHAKACARNKRTRIRVTHFISLAENVVEQTERRVIHGESVPSEDKIVFYL